MLNVDVQKLSAIISWFRETRSHLSPDDWEQAVALLKGGEVKGGDLWMADVVTPLDDNRNETDTIKTTKQLFPKTKLEFNPWIIYCRDPDAKLIDLLVQKREASLANFKSLEMVEWIILHDVDPIDPDYYQVMIWIHPQIAFEDLNIEWSRETKNADFYTSNGIEMFKRDRANATSYQTCLSQKISLLKGEAVFNERIYSPVGIPTVQEMIERYESKNSEPQCQ